MNHVYISESQHFCTEWTMKKNLVCGKMSGATERIQVECRVYRKKQTFPLQHSTCLHTNEVENFLIVTFQPPPSSPPSSTHLPCILPHTAFYLCHLHFRFSDSTFLFHHFGEKAQKLPPEIQPIPKKKTHTNWNGIPTPIIHVIVVAFAGDEKSMAKKFSSSNPIQNAIKCILARVH